MGTTANAGISLQGKLIIVLLGIVFIVFLFNLLKNRKISESLGLIWLTVSVGMVLVVINNTVLMSITHFLGAQYPASALTMIGLLFIISLLLYFTLKLTRLTQDLRSLVQQIAIRNMQLEKQIADLEKHIIELQSRKC
ncbi:MAG TPA: DUF2304 domain-containing protein [bacterium]|nr:DUF2304 domain-containing protein [bacterium]HPN44935.1 DUF2304 domain-containing protein [bacterium]